MTARSKVPSHMRRHPRRGSREPNNVKARSAENQCPARAERVSSLGRLGFGWISASRSVRRYRARTTVLPMVTDARSPSSMVGTSRNFDLRAMRAVSNSGGVRVHRRVGRPATRWQPPGATNRPTLDLGLEKEGSPTQWLSGVGTGQVGLRNPCDGPATACKGAAPQDAWVVSR